MPWQSPSVRTDELTNVYDYIVSTDDDLNDIINNQLSADESVWIGPGTHTVTKSGDNALAVTADNATVAGAGEIKLEDNASGTTSTSAHSVLSIGVSGGADPDGVTIKDVTVDGNKANNSNDIHAIGVFGATNYRIKNTECRNATGGGIKHDGANDKAGDDGEVLYNEVHNCQTDGIYLGGKHLRGIGNYVHDLPNQDGIEPLGDYQTWEGNVVKNTAGAGFDVYGCDGTTVEGNVIIVGSNGPETGVSFDAASSPGTQGSEMVGNVMIGSAITGVTGVSDDLVGVSNQKGCKAVGNVAYGLDVGTQIPHDSKFTLADNTFFKGSGAIDIQPGASNAEGKIVVRGNSVIDTDNHGIVSRAGKGVQIRDNTIEGVSADGIRLKGDNHHDVRNNVVKNAADNGIRDNAGATGNAIIDNTVVGCGGRGILLKNQDELRVIGNETRNNRQDGVLIKEDDGNAHSGIVVKDHHSDTEGFGIIFETGTGSIDDITVRDNTVLNPTNDAFVFQPTPTTYLIQNQDSWTAHASGTVNIGTSSTSASVTHGLDETPNIERIALRWGEDPTAVGVDDKWVSNIGSSNFDVNVDSQPSSTLTVAWEAKAPSAPPS